jgi:nucleoside-diphosphate-sugar epimerase
MMNDLPDEPIQNLDELIERLSRPVEMTVRTVSRLEGDFLILGAGGKMGPTLVRMLARAAARAGVRKKITAVSRFQDPAALAEIRDAGAETISCDLLDPHALRALPEAENILHLAGRKFGSVGNEPLTWAMNAFLPAMVMRRFPASRIVALSTGNVYSFSPIASGGSTETDPPAPVGEYAQSCLGRERMIQYHSGRNGTRAAILRLNYAIDLRYGVLLDIARKVWNGVPIDLRMGHVNIIWQGDANNAILSAFDLCDSPPFILNVAGGRILSVRALAEECGRLCRRMPLFAGAEEPTALLSDTSLLQRLMPFPRTPVESMLRWTIEWLRAGGTTLDKPTHYDARDGNF